MIFFKKSHAFAACCAALCLGGCGDAESAQTMQTSEPAVSEPEMLNRVNQARTVARYCGDTYFEAVPAVTWNDRIVTAAQGHSDDMAENNFLSHTGSNGSSAGERLAAAGYDWTAYNENIAAGYASAEAVVQGWLDSPGHCSNIMSPYIKEIGSAYASRSDSVYGIYWTLVGGRPAD